MACVIADPYDSKCAYINLHCATRTCYMLLHTYARICTQHHIPSSVKVEVEWLSAQLAIILWAHTGPQWVLLPPNWSAARPVHGSLSGQHPAHRTQLVAPKSSRHAFTVAGGDRAYQTGTTQAEFFSIMKLMGTNTHTHTLWGRDQ